MDWVKDISNLKSQKGKTAHGLSSKLGAILRFWPSTDSLCDSGKDPIIFWVSIPPICTIRVLN